MIASGHATSRSELIEKSGFTRTTVTAALATLSASGLIRNAAQRHGPGRGRPANRIELDSSYGVIIAAEFDVSRGRVALFDIAQNPLDSREVDVAMSDGPGPVLQTLVTTIEDLCNTSGASIASLRAAAVGLPGPIDTLLGSPIRPPLMPGWDQYRVADHLRAVLGCPSIVENYVSLRAIGEARALPAQQTPLLYVLVDEGVAGGLVQANGELYEGADGAAGDIGHIRVPNADAPCACGRFGCLGAVASGTAIAANACADTDRPAPSVSELCAMLREGDELAVRVVRDAAAIIGEIVADVVNFTNPARVVIGGPLAMAHDALLSRIRGVVYNRALPLATRNLTIAASVRGADSGIAGALVLALERALDPESIAAATEVTPKLRN